MPGTGVTTWKVGAPDRPLFASSKAVDRSQVFTSTQLAQGFDAIVDGSIAASDPDILLFKGVMEAIGYCDSVLGLNYATIGVKPGSSGGAAYVENSAAPYGDGSGLLGLLLIGLAAGTGTMSGSEALHNVEWTFSSGGTALAPISDLHIVNMQINIGVAGTWFFASSTCIFENVHIRYTTTGTLDIGDATSFNNGTLLFWNSKVSRSSSGTISIGAIDVTLTNTLIETGVTVQSAFNSWRQFGGAMTSTATITALRIHMAGVEMAGTVTVTTTGGTIDMDGILRHHDNSSCALTISGTSARIRVTGMFSSVTSAGVASSHKPKQFDIDVTNCDITGPAVVNIAAQNTSGSIVILRGNAISGSITTGASSGAAVIGLDAIGLTGSAISYSTRGTGTTGTSKPYAFDASSSNNVILYRTTGWANAGTNAGGATNVFVPDDLALGTEIDDHLLDPTDAHDASAVSFSPTGTIVATDVQAMGAELDGDIQAHIADATAAHAASAISYAGSAGLSASDVEAAIDELDTEKLSSVINDPIYRTRAW